MARRRLGVAVLACLVVCVASSSPAQDKGPSGTPAPQPPMLYNPQTVETVRGMVVSADQVTRAGLPEPVHLRLKTDRETINIVLGPRWFIDQQDLKITALDKIEVKGSRIILQGQPAIIAAEVKKGEKVMKLRDEQGAPYWGSRAQPQK